MYLAWTFLLRVKRRDDQSVGIRIACRVDRLQKTIPSLK